MPRRRSIETTVGRVLFSEIWPPEMGFPNKSVKKSELGDLIWNCYKICGHEKTVIMLDKLKELGFREATKAGVSIGIDDMIIPKEKEQEIDAAQKQIREVEKQYRKGVITPGERYNKIIDIWTHCTDQIANVMLRTLETNQGKKEYNPVSLMVDSGARGNRQQVRQLAGVRGLMAKPSGDIIEKPILSNFREGLTVLEYFISTHGARKGLADTALKTADSGYMTRKLVDVAQDVIIREEDCGTTNGIWVQAIYEGEDEVVKLSERLIGRYSCDDVANPQQSQGTAGPGQRRNRRGQGQGRSRPLDVERVKIRSVLTCESKHGVCMNCYGRNLATGARVKLGEAVGIIAAQSIGEPGTQLDHADLPHRRHRLAGVQAAADQGQVRRHGPLQRTAPGRTRRRQQHRPEQERLGLHPRRRRPRTRTAQRRHRLRHLRQGRRKGQERRHLRPMGSL